MSTNLATRTPSTELSPATTDVWSQMDDLFDEFRGGLFSALWPSATRTVRGGPNGAPGALLPAMADVEDKGDAYELQVNLPGMPKDKIDIRVTGNRVHLSAENATDVQENGKKYLRRERTYQGFERAFELPEPLLEEKVVADYKDGVLTLTMPKAHPVSERRIRVN